MMGPRAKRLAAMAERLGLDVKQVEPGTYVVQRQPARRKLVNGPHRRGGVDLLVNPGRARRNPGPVQRSLSQYLVSQQVAWVLRSFQVNCVLDVGANVGQYAKELRAGGYRGRIASFEPTSAALPALRKAAAKDPKWDVYPFALGSEDTTAEINTDPRTLSSLLPASEFGQQWSDRLQHQGTETIQVRRLDGVIDEVAAGLDDLRGYLKMDTQGFDLEVFGGAKGCLDQVVALQSEVACVPIYEGMPRLQEQLSTYEGAGFEIAGMYQVSRDPSTLRVIEFDMVMVRPDQVRRHP